ncbi:hypothetical protein GCM10020216_035710 [Nonomuraea helvata]
MVWEDAPYPMLAINAAGIIEQANEAARLLLVGAAAGVPLARVAPAWLSQAHREVCVGLSADQGADQRTDRGRGDREAARGPVGRSVFEAHPVHADGDRVTWWLVDADDHQRAVEELHAERAWTAFMVEASVELLSSLNLERCLEATARLAARRFADAALVVMPLGPRQHAIVVCDPRGEVVRESASIDTRTVPGLTEALQGFPPTPTRWIEPAEAPDWVLRGRGGEGGGEVGSVAVTALPGHGLPAGALVLLRRTRQAGFSDDEQVFAPLFTAWAGAAISVARLYSEQAAITETLMAGLLPPAAPPLEGVELAARYRPRGRQRAGRRRLLRCASRRRLRAGATGGARRRIRQRPGGGRAHGQDPQHPACPGAPGRRPPSRAGTAEQRAADRLRSDPLRHARAGLDRAARDAGRVAADQRRAP